MSLNFRGLERWLSHESYELMSSEEFEKAFRELAKEQGMKADEAFDQYLMCVTGQPVEGYTAEDVTQIQIEAVNKGFLKKSDVELMRKVRRTLNEN